MAIGVLSAGWYSILTGGALLYLAYVLGTVSWSADRAAPFVAAACAVTGVWQLIRGLRAEFRRRLERRPRARRQTTLLGGGPAPDPRLPQRSLDPNARFIGEQMGQGEG